MGWALEVAAGRALPPLWGWWCCLAHFLLRFTMQRHVDALVRHALHARLRPYETLAKREQAKRRDWVHAVLGALLGDEYILQLSNEVIRCLVACPDVCYVCHAPTRALATLPDSGPLGCLGGLLACGRGCLLHDVHPRGRVGGLDPGNITRRLCLAWHCFLVVHHVRHPYSHVCCHAGGRRPATPTQPPRNRRPHRRQSAACATCGQPTCPCAALSASSLASLNMSCTQHGGLH